MARRSRSGLGKRLDAAFDTIERTESVPKFNPDPATFPTAYPAEAHPEKLKEQIRELELALAEKEAQILSLVETMAELRREHEAKLAGIHKQHQQALRQLTGR